MFLKRIISAYLKVEFLRGLFCNVSDGFELQTRDANLTSLQHLV